MVIVFASFYMVAINTGLVGGGACFDISKGLLCFGVFWDWICIQPYTLITFVLILQYYFIELLRRLYKNTNKISITKSQKMTITFLWVLTGERIIWQDIQQVFFFWSRCEGITSPEGSKSIVEGIIEEEEEDEEGSESVNKRKKEDDMEVSEGLVLGKTEGGEETEKTALLFLSGGRDTGERSWGRGH